ncbi:GNAT family N-acetyltransferase [Paenibacillus soyae]|uniref:GNAT family N-acetyltransferase n=1 Tax=Paenibacillus soyae TaxID=2969249 RepID=A0A9X2MU08_9BACL|nr:GNAT family N-acetyltransferase [Paenibacillus soyae]MCR2806996.1 GNAT family N-acetyltransferase [Paenibacillus soyae]
MELQIYEETENEGKSYVVNQMIAFNLKHFPEHLRGRYQPVQLSLRDADGNLFGGLVGEMCWNWLEVQYLFVDEAYRKSGYGTKLLSKAEEIAIERRCDFIKLDTLSFQAIDFYKRQGFEVFGTIPNAGGHTHYYLKKDIQP